jgi:hypothetical protein
MNIKSRIVIVTLLVLIIGYFAIVFIPSQQKWPPTVTVSSEQYNCDEKRIRVAQGTDGYENNSERLINNRLYCIKRRSNSFFFDKVHVTYIYTTKSLQRDGIYRTTFVKIYSRSDPMAFSIINPELDVAVDTLIPKE